MIERRIPHIIIRMEHGLCQRIPDNLEDNPEQDFLGSLYHDLNLQQEQKGQFFTPYDISRFMAEIPFAGNNAKEELDRKGHISVNDPACGAGAMLIAFANA